MTRRVLVVDDNAEVAESLAEALEDHGIEVIGLARNGSEAVMLTHSLRPDVVLMDLRMPVLDGIKATRKIMSGDPTSTVLMLTAYEDVSLIAEAMDAGAAGYLVKGTMVSDMVVAIEAAAAKATARRYSDRDLPGVSELTEG